ncbi:MAG: phage head-tail connector protein [Pseudomonadota bacterium]
MNLKQVTLPGSDPVSLAEVKAHLRLGHGFADESAEDGLLQLYLSNATQAVERKLGQALIRREYVLRIGSWDRHGQLTLPIGPVDAIDSLEFVVAGETVSGPIPGVVVSPGCNRQVVSARGGLPLPPVPGGGQGVLYFSAGYGPTPQDVPGELRQAVLILAAHLYTHRGAEMEESSGMGGVDALLAPHRAVRI